MIMGARAQPGAKPAPEPRCNISPVRAIEIARGKVHGRAIQANFELDGGKWVYGVMIAHGRTIEEVEVDPLTGKIADVETVTPDGEAKELRGILNAAIGRKAGSRAEPEERGEKAEKGERE